MTQQKRLQSFLDTAFKLVTQPEVYFLALSVMFGLLFLREPIQYVKGYTGQTETSGELQSNWTISVTTQTVASGKVLLFSESEITYPSSEFGKTEVLRYQRFTSVESQWVGNDLTWSGGSTVLWHIEADSPVTVTTTNANETHNFYGILTLVCLGLWLLRVTIWLLGRYAFTNVPGNPEKET